MWICSAKLKKIQNEIERNLEIKLLNKIKHEQEIDIHVKSMPDKGTPSIWELIERCPKILAIISPIGLIVGGFVIYSYLSKLEAVSLFAGIISSPIILLTVVLVTSVVLGMILYGSFYAPYFITGVLFQCNRSNRKNYFISIFSAVLIPIFFLSESYWFGMSTILFYFLFIVVPFIWSIWVCNKKSSNFDKIDQIINGFLFYFYFIFSNLVFYLFELIIWESAGGSRWWLVVPVMAYMLNIIIVSLKLEVKNGELSSESDVVWGFSIALIFITILTHLIIPELQVASTVLNKLGYIEKNNRVSWYLIDKRFFNWYVQNDGNINRLRLEFVPKSKWVDVVPSAMIKPYYEYENSVYGYLAWNLGDTKIICPENVDITKPVDVSNDIHKCLMIKADYLQPLPKIK